MGSQDPSLAFFGIIRGRVGWTLALELMPGKFIQVLDI
jgi:hypothetical protein